MKSRIILLTSVPIVAVLFTACMTQKVPVVTGSAATGFSTNMVTEINTANLALDSAALQGATAIAVNLVLTQTKHDPGVVQALKNAHIAIDGILVGASQQTTAQVLEMLKIQNNAALSAQATSIMNAASALEQQLLAKYGASVAGQISIEILKSVDAGLAVGLSGQ